MERIELSAHQQHKFNNLQYKIELVPVTCWFSSLRKMLTSTQWGKLRRQVYEQANHKCEICGGVGRKHPVECHEEWYYDDENKIQKLNRLVALCPLCHEMKHPGVTNIVKRDGAKEEALQRFKELNQLSSHDVELFYQYYCQEQEDRGRYRWQMDLSLLESYDVDLRRSKYNLKTLLNYKGPKYFRKAKKKLPVKNNYILHKDDFKCPYCSGIHYIKAGKSSPGKYRYLCKNENCKRSFSSSIDMRPTRELKVITMEGWMD